MSPCQQAYLERTANPPGGMFGPNRDVGWSTSTGPGRRFTIVRLTDVREAGSLTLRSDILLLTTFIDEGRRLAIYTAKDHPDWSDSLWRGSVLAPCVYGK